MSLQFYELMQLIESGSPEDKVLNSPVSDVTQNSLNRKRPEKCFGGRRWQSRLRTPKFGINRKTVQSRT